MLLGDAQKDFNEAKQIASALAGLKQLTSFGISTLYLRENFSR